VRVAVVGGGFAGLFTASQLISAGVDDVVVLEASSHPGGVARSVVRDGYILEPGAGSFRLPHQHLSQLLAGSELRPAETVARHVWTGTRLVSLSGLGTVFAPIVPLAAKLRAAAEPWTAPHPGDDETLDHFFRRRFGDGFARTAAWLAASGVFAGDPTRLSAGSAFPMLTELETAHGSIVRGAVHRLRSRPKGATQPSVHLPATTMSALAEALAATLGERFRPGHPVEAVRRLNGRWTISGVERTEADHVVLACSPDISSGLVDSELREALLGSTSAPVAVIGLGGPSLGLPSGFGILTGRDSGMITRGILLESSYAPHRAPHGHGLVKVIAGGAGRPSIVDADDDMIVATVGSDLARILGADIDVSFAEVTRPTRGIPQYNVGHADWLAAVDRATPQSLHLTGWGYRGVGVAHLASDATRIAESIAPRTQG
jgi:protoporphyrinogen/coproporphyrinogen III oxidase